MDEISETKVAAEKAKLAELRAACAAGDVTLEQAAVMLNMPASDLMAMLALHEVRTKPSNAAIIAGADPAGVTTIRPLSDGTVSLTTTPEIAHYLMVGLLRDPKATLTVAAPLPMVESKGVN